MKIIEVKNYKELSRIASDIIVEEINKKPKIVIGFATGKTPKKTYKNLVKAYKNKKVDFSKITALDADEFYPIKKENKKSYYHYLFVNLFNKVNVNKKNIFLLNGNTKDPEKECAGYEKSIKENPVDLQLLGIGENGHIGFNEPGSSRNSKTRVVGLTHIKGTGITMGISTIMKAKKVILLASGKKKAKAIYGLVKGKLTEEVPASFLREHKDFILIIDKKAGSLL